MTDYTIGADKGFQYTFWCWALSGWKEAWPGEDHLQVLMHLVVLGVF